MKYKCVIHKTLIATIFFLSIISSNLVRAAPTHSDVTTVGGISAGLASAAVTLFSWGFGAPLQVAILVHTGILWSADKVQVGFVPDTNFNTTVAVIVPPEATIISDNLIHISDISAANMLLQDMAQIIGITRALDTSLNRQWTAASAGVASATILQRDYIANNIIPSLQTATASAEIHLAEIAADFTDVIITSAEYEAFVTDVNSNGFPLEEIDIFNLLLTTSEELDAALMVLNTPDPFSQPTYSLRSDGLQNSLLLMQQTVSFAQQISADAPTVPEPSTFILLILGVVGLKFSIKGSY